MNPSGGAVGAVSIERLPGRRLLAGVALACLLLCSAGWALAIAAYHNARGATVAQAEMRCRMAAAEAYSDRLGLIRLLQALASDPAMQTGDVPAITARLRAVGGEAFGFTGGLSWIGPDGRTLVSTKGAVGRPPGGRWWRDVVATGVWTTSAAVRSPAFDGEVLVFAVPTLDAGGAVNGVLAGGRGLDWLRGETLDQVRQLDGARYGVNTDLLLLDRAGRLLAGHRVETTTDVSGSTTYRRIMADHPGATYGTLIDVTGLTGQPGRLITYAGTGSFGDLVVFERPADDAFAGPLHLFQLRLVAAVVATLIIMGAAVLVARRADRLTRQRNELHRAEHAIVVDLQHSLLASNLPPGARARYLPAASALNVGGDWYDAIGLTDGCLLLVVGDVVGHGVRAALAMGQVRTATRALAAGISSPAALLTELDRYVEQMEDVLFCTAVCVLVDPTTARLRYSTAGHPPGLLRRADGTVTALESTGGMPLGLTTEQRGELGLPVAPGSLLVLYTDGLVERRGETIDTGIARLSAAVAEHRPAGDDWCDRIIGQSIAGAPQSDDIVLLSFRLDAAGQGPPAADSATLDGGTQVDGSSQVHGSSPVDDRATAGGGVGRAGAADRPGWSSRSTSAPPNWSRTPTTPAAGRS